MAYINHYGGPSGNPATIVLEWLSDIRNGGGIFTGSGTSVKFFDAETEKQFHIEGTDLVVSNGVIVSGTVTGLYIPFYDEASLSFHQFYGIPAQEMMLLINGNASVIQNLIQSNQWHVEGVTDFTGSAYADDILGSTLADILYGGAGDDVVRGYSGDDMVFGGLGNDRLSGGKGKDSIYGGKGDDLFYLTDTFDQIFENVGEGTDTVQVIANYVLTQGAAVEYLQTTNLSTTTSLNLTGNEFSQTITGNAGQNILKGMAGNDRLYGAVGPDLLIGGDGADRFIFKSITDSTAASSGRDTISDFDRLEGDKIDLLGIDANTKLSGNQAFKFLGSAAYTKTAGELRTVVKNGDIFIYGDVNGDGATDFSIMVDTSARIYSTDFIL